jgi:hypothetical protein
MAETEATLASISWPRAQVLQACQTYAPLLPPIDGIDPARLLAALAMNESSLGLNCGPEHEAEWDIGGEYASNPEQAKLLQDYPYLAACSFGPLQIMYFNAAGWGTPTDLNTDLSLVMRASIAYLGKQIKRWNLKTIQGIGQAWNWGHPALLGESVPQGVQDYCRDLAGNYVAAEGWLEQ